MLKEIRRWREMQNKISADREKEKVKLMEDLGCATNIAASAKMLNVSGNKRTRGY